MDPQAVSLPTRRRIKSVVYWSDPMLWFPHRGCKYRALSIQHLTRKISSGLVCPPKSCQHIKISQEESDIAHSEVQNATIYDRRYRGCQRGSEHMIRMLGNICFRSSHFQLETDADKCTTKQKSTESDVDHLFSRLDKIESLTSDGYGKGKDVGHGTDVDYGALEHENVKSICNNSYVDATYSGLTGSDVSQLNLQDVKTENRSNNAKYLATYKDRMDTDVDRVAATYIDRMVTDFDHIAATYVDRKDTDVECVAATYIDSEDTDVDRIAARYIDRMVTDFDHIAATYIDREDTDVEFVAATYIDSEDTDVDRIAARYIDKMVTDFDHITATYIDREDTDVDRVIISYRKAGNRSHNASRSSRVQLSSNSNHSRDVLLPGTSQGTNSDVTSGRLQGPVQYFPVSDTDFLLYENPGEYIVVNDGTYYGRIIRNPNWNPEPSWKPPWWDSAVSWFSRACVVGVLLTFGYVLFQKFRENGL